MIRYLSNSQHPINNSRLLTQGCAVEPVNRNRSALPFDMPQQRSKVQRSFQTVKTHRKMRNFDFFNFWSAAQLLQWTFWVSWSTTQFRNCGTAFSYRVKAQLNFRNRNFTAQSKYRIFLELRLKKSKSYAKQGRHLSTLRSKRVKLSSMYRIALLTKKRFESAVQLKRNKS